MSPKERKEEEEEEEKIWHEQQEKILKEWAEKAMCYRWMHDRAFRIYKTQNMRFAIPVIILSTVTGTANFAQESFPEAWRDYVPMGIGALNLVAGLLTTISQFLRVNELQEGHRVATISFAKFSRSITLELALPKADRDSSGKEFITQCCQELDRLIEQSPQMPKQILELFKKKHGKENIELPEILQLKKVTIFKEDLDGNGIPDIYEDTDTVLSLDSNDGCLSRLKKSVYGETIAMAEKNSVLPILSPEDIAEAARQDAEQAAEQVRARVETVRQEAEQAAEQAEEQARARVETVRQEAEQVRQEAEQVAQQARARVEQAAEAAEQAAAAQAAQAELMFSEALQARIKETEDNIFTLCKNKCEETEKIISQRFEEADKIISDKLTEVDRDIEHIKEIQSEN
jgi:hypothetical protein